MSSVAKNSIEAGTKDSTNNEELLQPTSPASAAVSHSISSVTSDSASKLSSRKKDFLVGEQQSPAKGDSAGQLKSPAKDDSVGQPKSPAKDDSVGQPKSPAEEDSVGQPKSPAEGDSVGQPKSPAEGDSVGQPKSPAEGDSVGQPKSPAEGDSVGQPKSPAEGDSVGQPKSPAEGDSVGQPKSPAEGDSVGQPKSPAEGDSVGQPKSPAEGDSVGQPRSPAEGDSVGQPRSPAEGDSVGQPRSPDEGDSVVQPKSPDNGHSVDGFKSPLAVDFIVGSIIPSSPEAAVQKSFEIEDTPRSSSPLMSLSVSFVSADTERIPYVAPLSTLLSPSVNTDKFSDPNISGSTERFFNVDNTTNSMPIIHSHWEKSASLSDVDVSEKDFVSCTQSGSFTHDSTTISKENYPSRISTSSYTSAVSQISPLSFRTVSSASKEADLTETRKLKTVGTQVGNTLMQSDTPLVCSKHKVPVISEDTSSVLPTGAPDLCLSCSKSMLSYIVLIQKFLEGLATNICKQIDPLTHCVECVKENLNLPIQSSHTCRHHDLSQSEVSSPRLQTKSKSRRKSASSIESETQMKTTKTQRDDSQITAKETLQFYHDSQNTHSGKFPNAGQSLENESQQMSKTHQDYSDECEHRPLQSPGNIQESTVQPAIDRENIWQHEPNLNHKNDQGNMLSSGANQKLFQQQHQKPLHQQHQKPLHQRQLTDSNSSNQCFTNVQQYQSNVQGHNQQQQNYFPTHISETQTVNDLQDEQHYPRADSSGFLPPTTSDHMLDYTMNADSFQAIPSPIISHGEGTDGILSTLYKIERGLRDIPKDLTVWERVAEIQGQVFERDNNEAFVTIARNNAEVLGCLVLGASLLLCGTSRTTCVLISDNVNSDFADPLSSLFHVVLHTRSLDSVGTTKLSLLDQPELGVTFGKLNIWRLEQFTKCVFLNPDTVVIQNCDELFCHEELSAVPDIGWPDCFNSGVFVFKPSVQTFWELLEFADKQRSYDGGEQGLLNSYFNSWSTDISRKLSFIYNLMANVSYTYTPAFKQFGRSVKVVQFWGPFKPWHVKFDHTGQIAQSSTVHPTYVQFVRIWLNLFRVCVLPQFSPDILSFASSQSSLSAYELLRFFPSPVGSDTEFLLTPPSVRVRPNMQSLQTAVTASTAIEKLQLPVTSNLNLICSSASEQVDQLTLIQEDKIQRENTDLKESESKHISISEPRSVDDTVFEGGELTEDSAKTGTEKPKSLIPGAEVGDYQGMLAWEQGRMDYEGEASSDTIIQRLRYLMGKPDRMS